MPLDLITLTAAFLAGLLGSVHCAVMCGGLASGFAASTGAGPGHATLTAAIHLNLGRVLGYTLAGLLVAGIGAGILRTVDIDTLAFALRLAVGAVLILVGLRLLDRKGRLAFLSTPGGWLWKRIHPMSKALLPADRAYKQVALGALWGWIPCGLSWTMLFAAWFTADALHGALTMAAFGLGTLPAMLPLTWGSGRLARRLSTGSSRTLLAAFVIVAGVITLAAPLLAQVPAIHAVLERLGCRTLPPG
ncbi:MAG TPA: sulfite exporter TauE/SafE family protein [Xanthomonadaceae bacterium]|nr:sulfite exporter TauE/SafE family protein [Xanthomonadaceae bacterium]